jgi:hypothetical protein
MINNTTAGIPSSQPIKYLMVHLAIKGSNTSLRCRMLRGSGLGPDSSIAGLVS